MVHTQLQTSMCVYVFYVAEPIMVTNITTIIKDHTDNANVMLTCHVQYAYPTPNITWNIMTESSSNYNVIEENSTGNYILHNNGSLEVYHRFIYEESHVTVMCLASNEYGYAQSIFNVYEHAWFSRGTYVHYNR